MDSSKKDNSQPSTIETISSGPPNTALILLQDLGEDEAMRNALEASLLDYHDHQVNKFAMICFTLNKRTKEMKIK